MNYIHVHEKCLKCGECRLECEHRTKWTSASTSTSPNTESDKSIDEKDCVFCEIVAEMDETKVTEVTPAVIMFEPLNPVVDGHLLLVPKKHVTDMSESVNTMRFMGEAIAQITKAYPECNVITSKGKNATQSIFHLHVHIVPREANDGLMLPWTDVYSLLMDVIGDFEITEENQDTGHDCYESFCDYCDKAVRDELRAEQRTKLTELFNVKEK